MTREEIHPPSGPLLVHLLTPAKELPAKSVERRATSANTVVAGSLRLGRRAGPLSQRANASRARADAHLPMIVIACHNPITHARNGWTLTGLPVLCWSLRPSAVTERLGLR